MTGKEFLRERKSLGWTQGKVAKVMGCAIRSVRRWETGEVRVPQALKTIVATHKAKQDLRQAVGELLSDLAASHPTALDTVYAGRVFRVLLEGDRNGI